MCACHVSTARSAFKNMNYAQVLTVKGPRGMYTTMNSNEINSPNRTAMINTLAVVGFVALIGVGLWLAVYSTRYVPSVVNRIGTAAVYLGSVFTPAEEPLLSVVPTPVTSTTLPFGTASTTATTTTTTTTPAPVSPKPVATTPGPQTSGTYPIGGTAPGVFSGLPDFTVSIGAVGYLASASTDSFIASSTVPAGNRPAVKFTIKNIGTNVAGQWRFSASIPTQSSFIYQSQPQQSLNPGDSIDYVLGFDQANRGSGQMISVTANFDHAVTESSTNNNSAAAYLTILGS